MRIIQGLYKNYNFKPYKGDNTRPTSERVKEQLFDILNNYINFEEIHVLDLFSGTGNISLEFLSRGAQSLVSIDLDKRNQFYIQSIVKELNILNWQVIKADALKFLQTFDNKVDVVFADPPYLYAQIHDLHQQLQKFALESFSPIIVVIEHPIRVKLKEDYLLQKKEIGDTCLSFYKYH